MVNRKKLRKNIIEDYRTLKAFSRITGITYNKLMLVFNTDSYDSDDLVAIKDAYSTTVVDRVEGFILDEDRPSIRLCLLTHFNSYTDFCKKHDSYNVIYITNVVRGRLIEATPKYLRLVNLLVRDYGLVLYNAES